MTEAPPVPPTSDQNGSAQQSPRHPFPQLRRSATDRMLGGVCGGLAEYSGIDPLLWRVGAVALTLAGPGLIVYLLLWLFMTPPTGVAEHDMSPVERTVTRLHERLTNRRIAGAA